jgi:hypothetical protein
MFEPDFEMEGDGLFAAAGGEGMAGAGDFEVCDVAGMFAEEVVKVVVATGIGFGFVGHKDEHGEIGGGEIFPGAEERKVGVVGETRAEEVFADTAAAVT